MIVLKPPEPLPLPRIKGVIPHSVFLAGSIEMGTADNWQDLMSKALAATSGYIFNPRRDDWDSSWSQEIKNPNFYEQVSWELTALDSCQVIAMYFDPKTKSPISLLELGLYAESGKLIVCCPEGFWKKGNVDIVCERHNVPLTNNIKDFIGKVHAKLRYP